MGISLGGGLMTFLVIALIVGLFFILKGFWRSIIGTKPLGELIGGAACKIGNAGLEIYKIRANSKKEKSTEAKSSKGLGRAEEIIDTLKSEANLVAAEQNFSPERVQVMAQNLSDYEAALGDQEEANQELLREDSEDNSQIKSLLSNSRLIIAQQNSIESATESFSQALMKLNLGSPELKVASNLAEEIKRSELILKGYEDQAIQLLINLKEVLRARTELLSQASALRSSTKTLLKKDPPLPHISEIQDNLQKISAILAELHKPHNSVDSLLDTKDQILNQIQVESTHVQERFEAQKAIHLRAKQFIDAQVAHGAAPAALKKIA